MPRMPDDKSNSHLIQATEEKDYQFLKLFAHMQIASMSAFGQGCRSAHFSITHYDVPPPGINIHQGWGVRSVIEIGVVL